jgi:hypothetical protein
MVPAAIRELAGTNVRFNEVLLACRVEVDSSAEQTGAHKASDFARVYDGILKKPEIDAARVFVFSSADFDDLKFEKHKGAQVVLQEGRSLTKDSI